ncbi:MAG: metal-sulfur cluster assembly factor [Chitinophagales bacterium]|nr:metal-sulfur cluster assembly factor [Chitinophagales bacterium]HNB48118.1 metal-sulfur cluster assembly factor [Chitinophagales bacterium]HRG35177.1 metal-sulfur cluster assembly factor [Chitinophagales bacterium]
MHIETNNENLSAIALEGLKAVIDPEIGLNVVDLGLIYSLLFDETAKRINCVMTLTSQFCPMGESIIEDVNNSLQSSFDSYGIDVNLTYEPAWNADMISEEGQLFLGR